MHVNHFHFIQIPTDSDTEMDGKFIRLQTGGCLDASGESYECTCPEGIFTETTDSPCEWTFAQRNLNMPLHFPGVRWRFEGPFLITYVDGEKRCLKFRSPVDF